MIMYLMMGIYLELFILSKCLSRLLFFSVMNEGSVTVILLKSGLLLIALPPPSLYIYFYFEMYVPCLFCQQVSGGLVVS